MSVQSKASSFRKKKVDGKRYSGKKQESDEDMESSEEELDLTKECHPIGHYVNDRPEMINQMFSVIKGNKLRSMLPPILKDCDLEQLKLQCLDQLLGMSEKRIAAILEGEILESSSECEVEDSEESDSDANSKSSDSSSLQSKDEEDNVDLSHMETHKDKHTRNRKKVVVAGDKGGATSTEEPAPEQGKTLLEILELEMRARAIRALLSQGDEHRPVIKEEVIEAAGEVVDLTAEEDSYKPPEPPQRKAEEKESPFEEKLKKSKEKSAQIEGAKKQKLQAELELRNKLFRKKIYRTRQQRLDNDEEGDKSINVDNEDSDKEELVKVKEEPKDEGEIVIEDPEEGEVSTSEDEGDVLVIKNEPELEPELPEAAAVEEELSLSHIEPDMDKEQITAIDNGTFVLNQEVGPLNQQPEIRTEENNVDNRDKLSEDDEQEARAEETAKETPETEIEEPSETNWMGRWLQRDGVQKLVKSSKICAKVKKRMRNADKVAKTKEDKSELSIDVNSDSNSVPPVGVVEGSVEEYKKLIRATEVGEESGSQEAQETTPSPTGQVQEATT